MLYIESRGVHEVEHWTRDAQLLLVASHKYSYVTVRHGSSAPLRGHLCVLHNPWIEARKMLKICHRIDILQNALKRIQGIITK